MAVSVQPRPARSEPALLGRPPVSEAIVEALGVNKRYDTGKIEVHALREVRLAARIYPAEALRYP